MYGTDDGDTYWAWTEPGRGADLVAWLESMRFMMRVEVTLSSEYGLVWRPGLRPATGCIVRGRTRWVGTRRSYLRDDVDALVAAGTPAGTWAYEARRIDVGIPRIGLDTDDRTIPNELGVPSAAVALDKGCYRGQETVARVHNLGRPPRRLVRLQLDGSLSELPGVGVDLLADGKLDRSGRRPRRATTSSGRSRWRWSSAACRSMRP